MTNALVDDAFPNVSIVLCLRAPNRGKAKKYIDRNRFFFFSFFFSTIKQTTTKYLFVTKTTRLKETLMFETLQ